MTTTQLIGTLGVVLAGLVGYEASKAWNAPRGEGKVLEQENVEALARAAAAPAERRRLSQADQDRLRKMAIMDRALSIRELHSRLGTDADVSVTSYELTRMGLAAGRRL